VRPLADFRDDWADSNGKAGSGIGGPSLLEAPVNTGFSVDPSDDDQRFCERLSVVVSVFGVVPIAIPGQVCRIKSAHSVVDKSLKMFFHSSIDRTAPSIAISIQRGGCRNPVQLFGSIHAGLLLCGGSKQNEPPNPKR
jgi:hypothetical protein